MKWFLNEGNLNYYQEKCKEIQKILNYLFFLVTDFTLDGKHWSVQLCIYKAMMLFRKND